MDRTFVVATAPAVRARIARIILGTELAESRLGAIRLHPHQLAAVGRIEQALHEFGGALLSDEVGMGKTFVALAVARGFRQVHIIGPAVLEQMWQTALRRVGRDARFTSFERLSRGEARAPAADLVIIDEAHHTRNRATRRYARVAYLCRRSPVLLLTATPIHNRRDDLVSLMALFLGSRADSLSEAEVSRLVVRRVRSSRMALTGVPEVLPVVPCAVPDHPDVVPRLMDLPPPLPPRDGDIAAVLVGRGLVHQWASSEAALFEAVRRRIARAEALLESLRAGRYPTRAELEAWTFADGALQLGFPELLASSFADAGDCLASVSAHADALRGFLARYPPGAIIDEARAAAIGRIRRDHAGARIVAFAQYEATIRALFRRLVAGGGAAMLSAQGARVAGGKMSRREVIERFAPRASGVRAPSAAERIDLLLATDLLSEGVNLQDADMVIHLDVPWTAARMDQRVGRVSRMGSPHSQVRVFLIRPPTSAETLLREEQLVSTKWALAARLVGSNSTAPLPALTEGRSGIASVPARTERLRSTLQSWLSHQENADDDEGVWVATTSTRVTGFLAAGLLHGVPVLLACRDNDVSLELDAQLAACSLADGCETASSDHALERALRLIHQWCRRYEAAEIAGTVMPTPLFRKRLLARINSAVQDAPPHVRAARADATAVARRVGNMRHGVALETELETLVTAGLPVDEWLAAVAELNPEPELHRASTFDFQLRAILAFEPGGIKS